MNDKLLEALNRAVCFHIASTFDPKGCYSERKSNEWREIHKVLLPLRDALASGQLVLCEGKAVAWRARMLPGGEPIRFNSTTSIETRDYWIKVGHGAEP